MRFCFHERTEYTKIQCKIQFISTQSISSQGHLGPLEEPLPRSVPRSSLCSSPTLLLVDFLQVIRSLLHPAHSTFCVPFNSLLSNQSFAFPQEPVHFHFLFLSNTRNWSWVLNIIHHISKTYVTPYIFIILSNEYSRSLLVDPLVNFHDRRPYSSPDFRFLLNVRGLGPPANIS